IEHLKHAAKKNGGGRVDFLLACCYAQNGRRSSRSSTCAGRSRRTSATGFSPATTGPSIPSASCRSSRSVSPPSGATGTGPKSYTAPVKRRRPSSKPADRKNRGALRPSVILLAAGVGSRLRSARPGVLHKVAGRTLLDASLETAA